MRTRITVELLEPCEDKEEAECKQHEWASTIKALGHTPQFRAKVMYRKGWGVWLVRSDSE